jgi:hypothetical protein
VFALLVSAAYGQQNYVTRYDVYAGYAFMDSPHIGLFENGVQTQAGIRLRQWVSLGVDYSYTRGNLTLTPDLLPDALAQQLQGQLVQLAKAGMLPSGYSLVVPAHSETQSFAAGPQFAYRGFERVTLFVRPSFGAVHEAATPKPGDPIAAAIVAQLAPTGRKTDWQGFYGFGSGLDLILTKHVSLRVQSDLAYDHLFNDILKDGRWTVRFSVGPCFNFGKNILE